MIIEWIRNLVETSIGIGGHWNVLISQLIYLIVLLAVAYLIHFLVQSYLIVTVRAVAKKSHFLWVNLALKAHFFQRLSHFIPAMIIFSLINWATPVSEKEPSSMVMAVHWVIWFYMVIISLWSFNALCQMVELAYQAKVSKIKAKKRIAIKPYLQVARLIAYFIAAIFIISMMVDKSPWALLTGLGAIAALLMLIFKDTILGLVASVQMSSYDIVRVGDWIVVPKYNANGDVTEVSLNMVKVQNFDKTITTIPTSALLTTSVTNWRGMEEAGGRRIKRSIHIDMHTIRFVDDSLMKKIKATQLLKSHVANKAQEIDVHNSQLENKGLSHINGRCLTNIGLFRAYCYQYLKAHPGIHDEFTFLVRQLDPTPTGLPIQLYIFTKETDWGKYEDIQSDIFDHLLAILPHFELKVFQNMTGSWSYDP